MARFVRKTRDVEALLWIGGELAAKKILDLINDNGGSASYIAEFVHPDGSASASPEHIRFASPALVPTKLNPGWWITYEGNAVFRAWPPEVFDVTFDSTRR